ncbi:hypothetical protein [Ereboglobus luteus]|uniref:Uncharacterized protein n=1 Tax=Ereboglobus luteus TaxID=1796921 RepID=A0A2U8E156_9BACT|nr:hypothetical protein [Ereboglobus luteus]AWI08302.1 hypothetical protein CKA38_02675 [Ereboglobus luteus]
MSRNDIARAAQSLDTLTHTDGNTYRPVSMPDLNGDAVQHDPLTYRRHTLIDARTDNTRLVTDQTRERERELQAKIALTLANFAAV